MSEKSPIRPFTDFFGLPDPPLAAGIAEYAVGDEGGGSMPVSPA